MFIITIAALSTVEMFMRRSLYQRFEMLGICTPLVFFLFTLSSVAFDQRYQLQLYIHIQAIVMQLGWVGYGVAVILFAGVHVKTLE